MWLVITARFDGVVLPAIAAPLMLARNRGLRRSFVTALERMRNLVSQVVEAIWSVDAVFIHACSLSTSRRTVRDAANRTSARIAASDGTMYIAVCSPCAL